jgi:predicted MFS family arabinose efflux permease
MIGGWLGALYGWRVAFFAVGLPGVLLAIALAVSLRASPPQSDRPPPQQTALSTLQACRLLLADRRFRWLLATNGIYSFLIFGPIAWLPAFFMRSHGLELRYVGTRTGVAIGFGMAAGMLIGGLVSDRLLRRAPGLPQWFCAGNGARDRACLLDRAVGIGPDDGLCRDVLRVADRCARWADQRGDGAET